MKAAVLAVLVVVASGCQDDAPAPAIEAVVPATVTSLAPTPARISGRDLYRALRVGLDDGTATIDGDWTAAIDGVAIPGSQRIDDRAVELTVPAGLAVGAHDVGLRGPRGEQLALPGALTVTDDPIGLVLAIEDGPGGAGQAVGPQAMRAGDDLTAWGVLRTPSGEFVADVGATWQVVGGLGEIAAVPPSAVTLSARTAGTGQLAATYDVATPAEPVSITVTAGDPAALAIESTPGGGGVGIPAQTLTTDDSLEVHAVLRDAFGNFVADTAATWSVVGGVGAIADLGALGGVFDPRAVGVGRLAATALGLPATTADLTIIAGQAATLSIAPTSLTTTADAAPTAFTATGTDADGNATADLGTLSWATTGSITAIGPVSGVLDPQVAGTGTVTVASSYGAVASAGPVAIGPGRAVVLAIAPDTLTLSADAAPVGFVATGTDVDGNATTDLGALTWTRTGPVTAIDPATGSLDPRSAGTGSIVVISAYGPTDTTGAITITPGRAAALAIAPSTLAVTADTAPVTFAATGMDADGNPTPDLGSLTWGTTGPITAIDPGSGVLDPRAAGTGTVTATSAYGPTAATGAISIAPGRAAALAVTPGSASLVVGDGLVLTAAGADADANPTSDLGTLSWSVAGGIGAIDAAGALTTTAPGTGSVGVVSSYGPAASADPITVSPIAVVSAAVPGTLSRGQHDARIELDVENLTGSALPVIAAWLGPTQGGLDRSGDYTIEGDWRNPDSIAPGATATLVLWVTVSATASLGAVDVDARIQTFRGVAPAVVGVAATWTVDAGPPPVAVIAPAPAHVCKGDTHPFDGTGSTGSSLTYGWDFDGGTPAGSTNARPTIRFSAQGVFSYALTVTDGSGREGTAREATPMHVGEPDFLIFLGEGYPADRIVPTRDGPGNVDVDLAALPQNSIIRNDNATRIRECDGTKINKATYRYITVWTDRGAIPPGQDQRPDLPGVQRLLNSEGDLPDTILAAGPMPVEGAGSVHGEFFHPALGVVTASGRSAITMVDDDVRPSITAAGPIAAPGCGSAICAGKDHVQWFVASEPLAAASVSSSSVVVTRGPAGSSCTDATAFTPAAATVYYDAAARAITVTPTPQADAQYKLRVQLTAAIVDTAATPNALVPYTVCTTLGDCTTPLAGPPSVTVSSATLSPDFDGTADTTTLSVTSDAGTQVVEIVLARGPRTLVTLTAPTHGIAGATAVGWDGRDATGRIVRDGAVLYSVRAMDARGQRSVPVHGVLTVDSAIHFIGVPK